MSDEQPDSGEKPTPRVSDLRIAKMLEKHYRNAGSYNKLERHIRQAVDERGKGPAPVRPVDRRKLKAIVEGSPDLALTLAELRGLDLYLERFGDGLAYHPLFEKPELLQCLAESRSVTFLLGSRPSDEDRFRINISHWDVLGMAEIQRGVNGFSPNVSTDIREVRMFSNEEQARASVDDGDFKDLFKDDGHSYVCMASSRGNPAAEVLLSEMTGVDAFTRPRGRSDPELPFHFVWSGAQQNVRDSCFHLRGEDLLDFAADHAEAVMERGAAAFEHEREIYLDALSQENHGVTYGVIVAQRRPNNGMFLIIAGLTGPGTFAASRWVKRMATPLADQPPDRQSPLYWCLVKANVSLEGEADSRMFQVEEGEIVSGTHAWIPPKQRT